MLRHESYHSFLSNSRLYLQVAVGAPLFEIDSDAQGVTSKVAVTTSDVKQPEVSQNHKTDHSHGSRTPSIKFLGKRSLLVAKHGVAHTNAPAAKAVPPAVVIQASTVPKKVGTGVEFTTLRGGALFGRPALSAREVEAIISGGATAI